MSNNAPPARVLIFLGSMAALIVGASLAVYLATPGPDRPDLLVRLGTVVPILIGSLGAAGPAFLSWLQGREANRKLETVAEKVEQVESNVNGRMSALIDRNGASDGYRDEMRTLVEEVLRQQREQTNAARGFVLPGDNDDDPQTEAVFRS